MPDFMVICHDLTKTYTGAGRFVAALRGLDLLVERGEMLAIVGPSGSGKSTLLNVLGGLESASSGNVLVGGHDLARLDDAQQARYRSVMVGYMWQQVGRNLVADLTLASNVDLPQLLNGTRRSHYSRRTRELLQAVGLDDKADRLPAQLSGGEQQRAALAVALANRPPLLLADEPTAELDSATAHVIVSFLCWLAHEVGTTVIVASHDTLVADAATRTLTLRDGRRVSEGPEALFPARKTEPPAIGRRKDTPVAQRHGAKA